MDHPPPPVGINIRNNNKHDEHVTRSVQFVKSRNTYKNIPCKLNKNKVIDTDTYRFERAVFHSVVGTEPGLVWPAYDFSLIRATRTVVMTITQAQVQHLTVAAHTHHVQLTTCYQRQPISDEYQTLSNVGLSYKWWSKHHHEQWIYNSYNNIMGSVSIM